MNQLIVNLPKHSKYLDLLNDIKSANIDLSVFGLTDAQKAHMIYSLNVYSNKPSCIVCTNNIQAKKMIQDLKFFTEIEIVYFPAREIIYYDIEAESKEIDNARMYAIQKIISGDNIIIVTTIDSILQKMLPIEVYTNLDLEFNIDSKVDINKLFSKLINLGYERCTNVEGKGQFAIRGGIIDIFGINNDTPHRIELFDDMIDRISLFDVLTQRSISSVNTFSLSFASEFNITENQVNKVIIKLKELISSKITKEFKSVILKDIKTLENREEKNLLDKYFEIFFDETVSFIDYLANFTVYVDEPVKCIEKSKYIIYENTETLKLLASKNHLYIPYTHQMYMYEDIEIKLKNLVNVYLERMNTDRVLHAKRKEVIFSCREVNFFRSSMDILIQDIKAREENIILLVYPLAIRVEQIKNILIDNKIKVIYLDNIFNTTLKAGNVYITQGILSGGFDYDDFKLTVISENVSGTLNRVKKNKKSNTLGQSINSFEDLVIGDYVVHESHGIGIYRGIETVEVLGVTSDYIKIEYLNGSNIFVPISGLDNVKKYMCDDDKLPKLNNLGNREWNKTKKKAKEHVEEIAKELVLLYAKRDKSVGFSYSSDTPWQKEFEDSFEYELTEDQAISINEVKSDMEDIKPMDRLLCGDVGYGKTEVAIRAAFKAVMDNKQVAYLVPTTILSLQQYNTFKKRMEKFSINVEMLSRFKTAKEQKKILKDLIDGKIDVLIGTHRILSKDVLFKDLGLLIVDEEHRFGVKDKESIKLFKETIDILCMTATPIPRTLHMSMVGIRGMSSLTTPPLERMPVHTYVLEYDNYIVKNAIERELSRDGQVFYISNRVDNIEEITNKVRELVPYARVEYAHGQMSPRAIEDIMIRYIKHEIDVIVCTTILESGIDIQNANTIIIENADRLGLAALYQIRGRVGRSNRLAYAYITYKKNRNLSEVAEKRLKAIKDFTEFGSGFKIAMRDLEIRGAGNILGKAQHGHMASVGYELYLSMLEKAISREKDGKIENNISLKEVKIDLPISAYISDTYISNIMHKITMYHKISEACDEQEIANVVDELIDRFGDLPKEVNNLIKIVEVRNQCRKIGITKVYIKNNYVILESDKYTKKLKYYINSNNLLLFIQINLKELLTKISD
ncbi:MAG: transcription-repair coupling factor [Clostridia bacterium]|nr:transcription-repair coupling factor [Clostridia bacterium]MDD4387142.1 transcription-repair coupling factor [Clostridia bacterium]